MQKLKKIQRSILLYIYFISLSVSFIIVNTYFISLSVSLLDALTQTSTFQFSYAEWVQENIFPFQCREKKTWYDFMNESHTRLQKFQKWKTDEVWNKCVSVPSTKFEEYKLNGLFTWKCKRRQTWYIS